MIVAFKFGIVIERKFTMLLDLSIKERLDEFVRFSVTDFMSQCINYIRMIG